MMLGRWSATSCEASAGSTPNVAASPLIWSEPRICWIWSRVTGCLGPEPTHEENTFPRPACVNLFIRPCTPPLCMRKPLRTVIMGFASVLRSAFPPSTELGNDITFLSVVSCLLTILLKAIMVHCAHRVLSWLNLMLCTFVSRPLVLALHSRCQHHPKRQSQHHLT